RVVSMPCVELFLAQPPEAQRRLVPEDGPPVVVVEAGRAGSPRRLARPPRPVFGVDRFRAPAPLPAPPRLFGFSPGPRPPRGRGAASRRRRGGGRCERARGGRLDRGGGARRAVARRIALAAEPAARGARVVRRGVLLRGAARVLHEPRAPRLGRRLRAAPRRL